MSILLIFGGALFMYFLVYKPELVAILLFSLMLTDINIDLRGLPLNSRALITLSLFGRILWDKATQARYPSFVSNPIVSLLLLFMVYIMFVSFSQDLFTFDLLKQCIVTVIAAYCVYHFFFREYNSNQLKFAIVIAGLVCFADLAYTYAVFGSFPVRRVSNIITGGTVDVDPTSMLTGAMNHNFFGQICGMSFVYVFSDVIKNRSAGKYLILLLPILFLGVLMSTSRSSLLGILIVALFAILNGIKYKEERKRIYRIITFSIGIIIIGTLLFSTIGMYLKLDSKFIDEVVFRLADEPIALVQKALGQNYNIQNLGSMSWREEASANAYAAYLNLSFSEQLFGIGHGGFIIRNLGQGLNPHNGVLLILITYGIVGFSIYLILIGYAIWQSVRLKNISPSFAVLLFILIYGIGQNDELTSPTTFLFVYALVAENKFRYMELLRRKTPFKRFYKTRAIDHKN